MGTFEFIDLPNHSNQQHWKCPCGGDNILQPRMHASRHLDWSTGRRIPEAQSWWPDSSVLMVTPNSPAPFRNLAYEYALVAQRDGEYDLPSFPSSTTIRKKPDQYNTQAYLYQAHGRVVGYLVTRERFTADQWNLNDDIMTKLVDGPIRRAVDLVFVAQLHRRNGIAQTLINAAAEHNGIEPTGLSWLVPFSEAGKQLAQAVNAKTSALWIASSAARLGDKTPVGSKGY